MHAPRSRSQTRASRDARDRYRIDRGLVALHVLVGAVLLEENLVRHHQIGGTRFYLGIACIALAIAYWVFARLRVSGFIARGESGELRRAPSDVSGPLSVAARDSKVAAHEASTS